VARRGGGRVVAVLPIVSDEWVIRSQLLPCLLGSGVRVGERDRQDPERPVDPATRPEQLGILTQALQARQRHIAPPEHGRPDVLLAARLELCLEKLVILGAKDPRVSPARSSQRVRGDASSSSLLRIQQASPRGGWPALSESLR
jgi:hypothetical protein